MTLVSLTKIERIVEWEGLRTFAAFTLSHSENGALPDYKKMDLMQIPSLVPHIWVYDLRNYAKDGKLLVNFAGESFTVRHKRSIIGRVAQDLWTSDPDCDRVTQHFCGAVEQKRIAHSCRFAHFTLENGEDQYQSSETLLFPCSTDNTHVNWAIGCASHASNAQPSENVYEYI